MTTSTLRQLLRLFAVLGLFAVAACAEEEEPPVDTGDALRSAATMTLTPSSGADGTNTVVQIRDAKPNEDITITYGAGTESGTTDASGSLDVTITVNGPAGSEVSVSARGGPTLEDVASAKFRITDLPPATPPESTSTTSSTVADPTPPATVVTVKVDPNSGKSGTAATITVTGPPNVPVTLKIRGTIAQNSGNTDANGVWTFDTVFNGNDDERISIEATAGVGADTGTGTTEFTIEPAANTAEPISLEQFAATQFHETEQLSPALVASGALSAILLLVIAAATADDFDEWMAFSIIDTNSSGTVDDGDVIGLEPQPFIDGRVEIGIDRGGQHFIVLISPGRQPTIVPGSQVVDPQLGPDAGWVLGPDQGDPVLIGSRTPGDPLPGFYDVDFGDPQMLPMP